MTDTLSCIKMQQRWYYSGNAFKDLVTQLTELGLNCSYPVTGRGCRIVRQPRPTHTGDIDMGIPISPDHVEPPRRS